MAQLLRLRKRARNLEGASRSLKTLLSMGPPDKENLTLALFSCTYSEYDEWRQALFRQKFLSFSTFEFLRHQEQYLTMVDMWDERLEILEKHFSFVCPNDYCGLRVLATHLFYDEYVRTNLVRFLYHAADPLLQFRRNPTADMSVLATTKDMLQNLYSWYHSDVDECTLTNLWENVYMTCYRQRFHPVVQSTADDETVLFWDTRGQCVYDDANSCEQHLRVEYDLCRYLPGAGGFFEAIQKEVMGQLTVTDVDFSLVVNLEHVWNGMVRYRPSLVRESIDKMWEKRPWEAVALTGRVLLTRCEEEGDVRLAVLEDFQRHLQRQSAILVKSMAKEEEELVSIVVQHGGNEVVPCLVVHFWNARTCPATLKDARSLLRTIERTNEAVSLPLRALVHDLVECENYHKEHYRVYLCRSAMGSLPTDEIASEWLPEGLGAWKQEFQAKYTAKYPHRRLRWLDWHSTVELTCGKTMSLVHVIVLRLLEERGPMTVKAIAAMLGWETAHVGGVVHSLVFHKRAPLLSLDAGGKKIRENSMVSLLPPCASLTLEYCLPKLSGTTGSASVDHREAKHYLEAAVVRLLKREGPLSHASLVKRLAAVECLTIQALESLVEREYVRKDTQDNYHYLA